MPPGCGWQHHNQLPGRLQPATRAPHAARSPHPQPSASPEEVGLSYPILRRGPWRSWPKIPAGLLSLHHLHCARARVYPDVPASGTAWGGTHQGPPLRVHGCFHEITDPRAPSSCCGEGLGFSPRVDSPWPARSNFAEVRHLSSSLTEAAPGTRYRASPVALTAAPRAERVPPTPQMGTLRPSSPGPAVSNWCGPSSKARAGRPPPDPTTTTWASLREPLHWHPPCTDVKDLCDFRLIKAENLTARP